MPGGQSDEPLEILKYEPQSDARNQEELVDWPSVAKFTSNFDFGIENFDHEFRVEAD
jgi:hypothetical protein